MDVISFSEAATANGRIEKFIENPDSTSGIVTVPSTIALGETITIPVGRIAVLPNVTIDGTLVVDGEVFVPSGATFGDLDAQLALKAPLNSAALVTPTINGVAQSGYTGFKNFIINGNFAVNQYADINTAPITAVHDTYKIDRQKTSVGTVTATIQRLSAQTVNGIVTNTLKFVATSTASGYMGSAQPVENFHKGETLTFGVWVKSNNANAKFFINDGVVASTYSSNHTGDGTWQFLTATKTISASATQLLCWVGIVGTTEANLPITTGDYVESTMWQLESGTVATPFEQRPIGLELSLCQRYYETGEVYFFGHYYSFAGNTNNNRWYVNIQFKEKKRIQPSMAIYDNVGTAGMVSIVNSSGSIVASGIAGSVLSSATGLDARGGSTGSVTAFPVTAQGLYFKWVVTAEF